MTASRASRETVVNARPMLPHRIRGEIDYASLDFNPDVTAPSPDAMEQDRELHEIHSLLHAHIAD